MGFHDEALKVVIPARYDFAFPFRDGRAKVGMDCVQYPVGEHSSVQCKSWEYIDGGAAGRGDAGAEALRLSPGRPSACAPALIKLRKG